MEVRVRLKDAVTRVYDNPEVSITLTGREAYEVAVTLKHSGYQRAKEIGYVIGKQLEGLRLAPDA